MSFDAGIEIDTAVDITQPGRSRSTAVLSSYVVVVDLVALLTRVLCIPDIVISLVLMNLLMRLLMEYQRNIIQSYSVSLHTMAVRNITK